MKPTLFVRRYYGNPPPDCVKAASLKCENGLMWDLYPYMIGPDKNNHVWINLKLCCRGLADNKANFWLSYNSDSGKFRQGKDQLVLETKLPALAERTLKFLTARSNRLIKRYSESAISPDDSFTI